MRALDDPTSLASVSHSGRKPSRGSGVRKEDPGPRGDRSGSRPLWDFHEQRGLRRSAWPKGRLSGFVSRGQKAEGPGHSLTRASNVPSAPRASPRAPSSRVIHRPISLLGKPGSTAQRLRCGSYTVRIACKRQTQDSDPWLI